MKLKSNLTSIGDSVKNRLGGLFGTLKSSPATSPPPPPPQQQDQQQKPASTVYEPDFNTSSSIAGGGRIFGRPMTSGTVTNENYRPFRNATNNGISPNLGNNSSDEASLSRSVSPNPFKMASSGLNRQTNNDNYSPFARFDGVNSTSSSRKSPQPPSNNIFDDI